MGEVDTLPDHPAVIDMLVATARDPAAAETDRAELSVIVSPFGPDPAVRGTPGGLLHTDVDVGVGTK